MRAFSDIVLAFGVVVASSAALIASGAAFDAGLRGLSGALGVVGLLLGLTVVALLWSGADSKLVARKWYAWQRAYCRAFGHRLYTADLGFGKHRYCGRCDAGPFPPVRRDP